MDIDASCDLLESGSDNSGDGSRKRLRADSSGEEQSESDSCVQEVEGMARLRARNWVFTLNNPGADWTDAGGVYQVAASAGPDEAKAAFPNFAVFLSWQIERGKEGTSHVQGYMQCARAVDLGSVRKWLPRAHWEIARGTPEQCIAYTSKESTRVGGPWCWGTPKKQGQRTDIDAMIGELNAGQFLRAIAIHYPSNWLRYHRGIRSYKSILGGIPRPNLSVRIYWGRSGVGKSWRAKSEYPFAADIPETKEGWLGDYTDEGTILFDDFIGIFPERLILKICSHHAHSFAVKGGFIWLLADTIIFTSNTDPHEWFVRKLNS